MRAGLPFLYTELHRLVHPRPVSGGSHADRGQVSGSAAAHLCEGHDVHQPASTGGCGAQRHFRPKPDRSHYGADRRGRSDQYGERRSQTLVHVSHIGNRSWYR